MSGELNESAQAQANQQYRDCMEICKTRLIPPVETEDEFKAAFKSILDLAASELPPNRTVEVFYQSMHRVARLDETLSRADMSILLM